MTRLEPCCSKRLLKLESTYGLITIFVCNMCGNTYIKHVGENSWKNIESLNV